MRWASSHKKYSKVRLLSKDILKLDMEPLFKKNEKDLENYSKWQFNGFFLQSIIPALQFMIKDGRTHPMDMNRKSWNIVLKDMESGFKAALKKANHKKITLKEETKVNLAFDLFKEHFFDLWD